jgi:hypothetical protein
MRQRIRLNLRHYGTGYKSANFACGSLHYSHVHRAINSYGIPVQLGGLQPPGLRFGGSVGRRRLHRRALRTAPQHWENPRGLPVRPRRDQGFGGLCRPGQDSSGPRAERPTGLLPVLAPGLEDPPEHALIDLGQHHRRHLRQRRGHPGRGRRRRGRRLYPEDPGAPPGVRAHQCVDSLGRHGRRRRFLEATAPGPAPRRIFPK